MHTVNDLQGMTISEAIQQACLEKVREFIANGIDLNKSVNNGEYLLEAALLALKNKENMAENRLKILQLLLESGANPKLETIKNLNLLHNLFTKLILAKLPNFYFSKKTKHSDNKILIKAIELLIEYGSACDTEDEEGNTPFLLAMKTKNITLANMLLQKAINVHHVNKNKQSVLHLACYANFSKFIPTLIEQGLNVNQQDDAERTPLDYTYGHLEIIFDLMKAGADTQKFDIFNCFRMAQDTKYEALTYYLINEKSLASYKNANNETALHIVKTVEYAKLLIEKGADVNAIENSNNHTQLHRKVLDWAWDINNNNLLFELVDLLINSGANLELCDNAGNSLLHMVANSRYNNLAVLDYLQNKGLQITDICNHKHQTLLHLAAENANFELISKVIDEISLSIRDNQGQTALELLTSRLSQNEISEANLKLIDKLLNNFFPSALPSNAYDLLYMAIYNEYLDTADQLFARGLKINHLHQNTSPLNFAIRWKKIAAIHWLLDKGASIKSIEFITDSPLQVAVQSLNLEIIELLLLKQADINETDKDGNNLLHKLIQAAAFFVKDEETLEKSIQVLGILLDNKININHINNSHLSPLSSIKFYLNNPNLLVFIYILIKRGAVLFDASTLQLYLDQAIEYQFAELITLLLKKIDIEKKSEIFTTIISNIIERADIKMLAALMAQGLNIDQIIFSSKYPNTTPLEYAVLYFGNYHSKLNQQGDIDISIGIKFISYLIEQGASLYFPSAYLPSFLHAAVYFNWPEIVKLLLSPPYNMPVDLMAFIPNSHNFFLDLGHQNFFTLLEVAVHKGHTNLVQLLLQHKAKINLINREPLLHIACRKGYIAIVEVLIEAGTDVNVKWQKSSAFFGCQEVTPLFIAINHSQVEIKNHLVQLLLQQQAQVDEATLFFAIKSDLTPTLIEALLQKLPLEKWLIIKPLHMVLTVGNLAVANMLLDQYHHQLLNYSYRDNAGKTALHLATHLKNTAIFVRLVKLGWKIEEMDNQGYTAKVYAIFHDTLTHCNLSPPHNFNLIDFKKLQARIINEAEFEKLSKLERHYRSAEYCYKLIRLFNSAAFAEAYINRFRPQDSQQPLHDLCLFNLPSTDNWQQPVWAKLALTIGSDLTKYLHFAPRIEQLLGKAPATFAEIQNMAAKIIYNRENENLPLAELFIKHTIDEIAYNKILDNFKVKTQDHIPNIEIDGKIFNEPRFYLKKLPKNDYRGFILGALTHCCQSVGSAGEVCAWHGMTSPYGGFYVIFKRANSKEIEKVEKLIELAKDVHDFETFLKKLPAKSQRQKYQLWREDNEKQANKFEKLTSTEILTELVKHFENEVNNMDELVAQSWVWISDNNSLVFDSWERLRQEDDRLCPLFLKAVANILLNQYGFNQVLLGQGGQTPQDLDFLPVDCSEMPKDYFDYRDSKKQLIVAKKLNDENKQIAKVAAVANKLIEFSGLFTTSPVSKSREYSSLEIKKLLALIIKGKEHIIILEPFVEANDGATNFYNQHTNLNLSFSQNFKANSIYILPIQKFDTSWSSLIIETSNLEQSCSIGIKRVIYLNMSGERLPTVINNQLTINKHFNYRQIVSSNIIYDYPKVFSGMWVITMIKNFINSQTLDISPILNFEDLIEECEDLVSYKNNHTL